MECEIERNRKRCECTYEGCDKKGKCCECVAYHRRKGEIPGCFFPASVERSYDRSIRRFVEAYK